jgi:hypothetical protein
LERSDPKVRRLCIDEARLNHEHTSLLLLSYNWTARTDIELIAQRLKAARQDYEAAIGKSER